MIALEVITSATKPDNPEFEYQSALEIGHCFYEMENSITAHRSLSFP